MHSKDVYACAETWLGVPWRHQGRSRQGVDCAGLIICVGNELGLIGKPNEPFNTPSYQRHAHGFKFLERFREQMHEVPLGDTQAGDVLIFSEVQFPCHCGIISGHYQTAKMIHAYNLQRKVIEEPLKQSGYENRIVACFRFNGVD